MSPDLNASALYIPTFVILLGILMNWTNNSKSEKRLDRMEAKLDALEVKLVDTRMTFEVKLDQNRVAMEAKLDQNRLANHRDILEVMKTMIALHERVAIVESKQA